MRQLLDLFEAHDAAADNDEDERLLSVSIPFVFSLSLCAALLALLVSVFLSNVSLPSLSPLASKIRSTSPTSTISSIGEQMGTSSSSSSNKMASWPPQSMETEGSELATFAAGCFWGVELRFQRVPGVLKTCVGYIQGHVDNPTYEQTCSGKTGHTEAVQMTYDPKQVTFGELCDVFYAGHNPTQLNRQGGDVGTQYRSGIYYHTEEQKKVAEEKKSKVQGAVTEIQAAKTFWPAEQYHQQYLEKGGRFGSGQSAAKRCTDKIRCYG